MTRRTSIIIGFTIGYFGFFAIVAAVAYLVLMPFGYGYVGAELVGAYSAWCTINQWETVNQSLAEYLELHNC